MFVFYLCLSHNIATDGSDYKGVSADLVFTVNSSNGDMQCIDVDIIDDMVVETNETFTVTLTTSNQYIRIGNNMATVDITNAESVFN